MAPGEGHLPWRGVIDFQPVPYHPGLRIAKGMRVRLPGGGIFQVLDVRDDDDGNPGVVTLDLEPIAEDE